MKVLHIMPFGIFAVNYINAFNKTNKYDHTFWLYGYSKEIEIERNLYFENDKNIMRIAEENYYTLEKVYNDHDILIIQSIPETLKLLNLIYEYYRKSPKPYILCPYGRDSNRTSDIYKMDKAIWFPIDKMKMWLVENSSCIASTQKIYNMLKELYHAKCPRLFFSNLLLAFDASKLNNLNWAKNNEKLNIMIGHRGTETSEHLKFFKLIVPHKKEIERIICPLVYGEQNYIKKVNRTGRIKFGNKWKPIFEWMETNAYLNFLNENVDVALFCGQFEGASTMYALAYMGKMIYLYEDSETAEVFNEIGITYSILNTKNQKNISLKTLSSEEKENNKRKMAIYGSTERFNEQWSILIDECYKNWKLTRGGVM